MLKIQNLEKLVKAIGLLSVCLYASGFLVINAWLSLFGVSEFAAISARYIAAGFHLAAFLIIYWIGFGNLFFNSKSECELIESNLHYLQKSIAIVWSSIVVSIACLTFFTLTAITYNLVFISNGGGFKSAIIVIPYVLYQILIRYKVDYNFPRFFLVTISLARLVIFSGAIVLGLVADAFPILLVFGAVTCFIGFFIKTAKSESGELEWLPICSNAVFSVVVVAAFGTEVFRNIKKELGGGAPTTVNVTLNKSIHLNASTETKFFENSSLIYVFEKSILVNHSEQSLILPMDSIEAISMQTPRKK